MQFGGGYEFTAGVETEDAKTLMTGTSFEVGAFVPGFPATQDGIPVTWPSQCKYQIRPYYYEASNESDYGVEHRYIVVDYVVPDDDLDRSANMAACKASAVEPPPPSSLVAHWKFDGDTQDSSGNGFHGSASGEAAFSNGVTGQALDLRDGDGWVDISGNVLSGLPECTIAAWVNVDNYTVGDPEQSCCNSVFHEDSFTTGGIHFILALQENPVEVVIAASNNSTLRVDAPATGQWVHYAWSYQQATGVSTVYVDSEIKDQETNVTGISCGSNNGSTIGVWDSSGAGDMTRFYDG